MRRDEITSNGAATFANAVRRKDVEVNVDVEQVDEMCEERWPPHKLESREGLEHLPPEQR